MGDRIRKAREAAGLSQAELGQIIGVRQQSVARWEAGESDPSTHRLTSIAETLSVPVASLLSDVNEAYIPGPGDEPPVELSASGVDLDELRRLDPDAYELIVRQAVLALERARERRKAP